MSSLDLTKLIKTVLIEYCTETCSKPVEPVSAGNKCVNGKNLTTKFIGW